MHNQKEVDVLGVKWAFVLERMPMLDRGECDLENKTMRVYAHLPKKELLEVAIHEYLHAADWYKDEEWVDQAGKDLTELLSQIFEFEPS